MGALACKTTDRNDIKHQSTDDRNILEFPVVQGRIEEE
jgi:hypothetical protein